MATEEDRQEQRDRLGNDPLETPPLEQLEEENPTESPASDSEPAAFRRWFSTASRIQSRRRPPAAISPIEYRPRGSSSSPARTTSLGSAIRTLSAPRCSNS
jgi:hypothetical protein